MWMSVVGRDSNRLPPNVERESCKTICPFTVKDGCQYPCSTSGVRGLEKVALHGRCRFVRMKYKEGKP
jgi:hypothetical protein